MGWFSGPKSDAERAAAQIELQHDGADVAETVGKAARLFGANKIADRCEREAAEDRKIAAEIESDGRVRGWW
ncbi:hypothetical protein [Pseudonocardia sp. NPDC049635]|uniref:hypothetical protein n=1 Tax=Pseudonocardia sp. NPDC049635 TaxID=3155506 RepID=UPI0033E1E046